MMTRARIICVDDEKHVLDALAANLFRLYEVLPATSGAEGLELLAKHPEVQVIISDMRMPGMDGATFLARAKEHRPDVPRVLLTGQADLPSAIEAVNSGQLFRFLTKPCGREHLEATIAAAVEQHRLITAEHVLLEKTLHGSVAALVDILALTNPQAFGRASRIRSHVRAFATALALSPRWQVEMAALIQPIGYVVLPSETVEKLRSHQALDDAEKRMVARIPTVTEQLLGHIPRLEDVRAILTHANRVSVHFGTVVERGSALLRIANELDDLQSLGKTLKQAVEFICSHVDRYPPQLIAAATKLAAEAEPEYIVHDIAIDDLKPEMLLAEDVMLTTGSLLVARGFRVNHGFIERLRNYPAGAVRLPIRILAEH